MISESRIEFIRNKISEICDIAQKTMNHEEDAIMCCRRILSLLNLIEFPRNDIYYFFTGIVSQTDDIPRGDLRNSCAEQFLQTKDREANEFIAQVRSSITLNCQKLIDFLKEY
jgi:hypothetical protein